MKKVYVAVLLVVFFVSSIYVPLVKAEVVIPALPKPGSMVFLSQAFVPAHLKGIVVNPQDPFKFDFLVNPGEEILTPGQKNQEYNKLIKYFLAALTVPDKDQWVNLSPYEKDRVIADGFGKTQMGRDLLAQDYLLKQITSSLMYPETGLGKKFWDKVYAKAYEQLGHTNIPVNTFNKVWIVPDKAVVLQSGNTAFVETMRLKVLLESDYNALLKQNDSKSILRSQTHKHFGEAGLPQEDSVNQVIRQIILPELEREVNEGKNFAALRQVFSSMVLATWYKRALKESLLGQIYVDKAKVQGINQDPKNNQEIYQQYVQAFKKGVYNYIKEDVDKYTQQPMPRKYFAGGAQNNFAMIAEFKTVSRDLIKRVVQSGSVFDAVAITFVTLSQFGNSSIRGNFARRIAATIAGDFDSKVRLAGLVENDGVVQTRFQVDQKKVFTSTTKFLDKFTRQHNKFRRLVAELVRHGEVMSDRDAQDLFRFYSGINVFRYEEYRRARFGNKKAPILFEINLSKVLSSSLRTSLEKEQDDYKNSREKPDQYSLFKKRLVDIWNQSEDIFDGINDFDPEENYIDDSEGKEILLEYKNFVDNILPDLLREGLILPDEDFSYLFRVFFDELTFLNVALSLSPDEYGPSIIAPMLLEILTPKQIEILRNDQDVRAGSFKEALVKHMLSNQAMLAEVMGPIVSMRGWISSRFSNSKSELSLDSMLGKWGMSKYDTNVLPDDIDTLLWNASAKHARSLGEPRDSEFKWARQHLYKEFSETASMERFKAQHQIFEDRVKSLADSQETMTDQEAMRLFEFYSGINVHYYDKMLQKLKRESIDFEANLRKVLSPTMLQELNRIANEYIKNPIWVGFNLQEFNINFILRVLDLKKTIGIRDENKKLIDPVYLKAFYEVQDMVRQERKLTMEEVREMLTLLNKRDINYYEVERIVGNFGVDIFWKMLSQLMTDDVKKEYKREHSLSFYGDGLTRRFFDFLITQSRRKAGLSDGTQIADDVGGIDMDAANLDLLVKRDDKGMVLPVAKQNLVQLSKIQGLVPRIIEIIPAAQLPAFNKAE